MQKICIDERMRAVYIDPDWSHGIGKGKWRERLLRGTRETGAKNGASFPTFSRSFSMEDIARTGDSVEIEAWYMDEAEGDQRAPHR
jgi:hypothetical protein